MTPDTKSTRQDNSKQHTAADNDQDKSQEAAQKRAKERALEEALKETFPASDPVSIAQPHPTHSEPGGKSSRNQKK